MHYFQKRSQVQEISTNLWLISISEPLPITIRYEGKELPTQIVKINSILKLQPDCISFVGSTRLHTNWLVDAFQNITYRSHPINISFKCCEHLSSKIHIPDQKPLMLTKVDVEDLNVTERNIHKCYFGVSNNPLPVL